MSSLHGHHWIAGVAEAGEGEPFAAIDPIGGQALEPVYREAGQGQIERACRAADAAKAPFAAAPPELRAALLRTIADGLLALGEPLLARITHETALPRARAEGERARTMLQLRQFAALLDDGSWVDARIDHADRQRQPVGKPDVRRMLVALGPVAVFGASNFPLAYSVAGGDTASALAAGCPVVGKGHPAHPGTSELVAAVIAAAVERVGLPAGVFSLLHGRTTATGAALVVHPAIAAVGFTGSHQGGRALFDLAAARPSPIPVFAEMGSMNPVFVLPQALAARGLAIAEAIASSALLAQGQFCTSPGLVAWVHDERGEAFAAALQARVAAASAGPAVHPTIRSGYERALGEVQPLAQTIARAQSASAAATSLCPTLLRADASTVLQQRRLRSEIYGPAVLAVPCANAAEMLALAHSLHGHLTATVHGDGDDFARHHELTAALRDKVGRLIANSVPTGVEVCPSMVHGGPYPAATDARFSAVGTSSIQRWVRPVCWQDWPHELLPPELRDDNPRRLRRMVDGAAVDGSVSG